MYSTPSIPPVPLGTDGVAEDTDTRDAAAPAERWNVRQWCFDVFFGVAALVVGVAGLVLPVLPGWLALLAGLIVLAGRIPPLRRLLTRIVLTAPFQRFLTKLATHRATRRMMARGLLRSEVRRAVEPKARWKLVNLLAKSAERDDESYE